MRLSAAATRTGRYRAVRSEVEEQAASLRGCALHLAIVAGELAAVASTPHAVEVVRRARDSARARAAARRGRGLVVDDDELVALAFGRDLETAGYAVTLALTYSAAWQRLSQPWACVVVDLVLADREDGSELCRAALRAGVPRVVLVSGYAGTELAAIAGSCGAHVALAKPLEPGALVAAVRGRA